MAQVFEKPFLKQEGLFFNAIFRIPQISHINSQFFQILPIIKAQTTFLDSGLMVSRTSGQTSRKGEKDYGEKKSEIFQAAGSTSYRIHDRAVRRAGSYGICG